MDDSSFFWDVEQAKTVEIDAFDPGGFRDMDTYGSRGGERLEGYQWIILCIYVYTFRAETKAFIPVNVLRIPVLICSSAFASSPGDERLIYKYIFSKRGKPKGNRSGDAYTYQNDVFF